ncbi:MAG: hypothetical protein EYC69_05410 [Bacteroidetes bacterium]|nr:MAG: hypothetical protein EYC69_05410 [Bacteroidota bacterium]
MKYSLILFLFLFICSFEGSLGCDKCDIEVLSVVNQNMDNLNLKMVTDFICTFDSSCQINVEYSEWSNETLFKVIDKATDLYFVAFQLDDVETSLILDELENPIMDVDIQRIYNRVKSIPVQDSIKSLHLNSLLIAAGRSGQLILR